MKQTFIKVLCIGLLATFAGGITTSFADEKPAAAEASKATKPKQAPYYGKLFSVDKAAQTITLDGKTKKRTFQVTAKTKIMKDGKAATLNEAKAGDEVGGSAREVSEGKWEATSLRLGPKPAAEAQPKKEKKAQ
jgi:hypothetical protein